MTKKESEEKAKSGVFSFHLSVSATTKILGVSRPTVQGWIDSGELKLSKVPGRVRRYIHVSTLYDFLTSRGMAVPRELNQLHIKYLEN